MVDSTMSRGCFITLEGSEGVGKSTNLQTVCDTLAESNIDVYATREPGGTKLAEALRDLLLAQWAEPIDGLTELLIVFAARNQHVRQEILPRLQAGQWVVCDRFTDATVAYQGYARGLPLPYIQQLKQWVQADLEPDLTLYLDIDPDVALQRIAQRSKDRLEQEQAAFFDAVRKGYQALADQQSRIRVIDASQTLPHVQAEVRRVVQTFVNQQ